MIHDLVCENLPVNKKKMWKCTDHILYHYVNSTCGTWLIIFNVTKEDNLTREKKKLFLICHKTCYRYKNTSTRTVL
jgi:hypothetical protein